MPNLSSIPGMTIMEKAVYTTPEVAWKVNLAYSHQLLWYASKAVGFLDAIRILIHRPFHYLRSIT